MPPVDQAWLTDQILEIVKGVARVEAQFEGLSKEVGEIKASISALPCPSHSSALTQINERLGAQREAKGWHRKAMLVFVGALLSLLGGLASWGLQQLLTPATASAHEIPQAESAPAPEPKAQIEYPDAFEALTSTR